MKKDTQCPKCGYDAETDYLDLDWHKPSKIFRISHSEHYFDGEYYRLDWTVECTCPNCETKFSFDDSDT